MSTPGDPAKPPMAPPSESARAIISVFFTIGLSSLASSLARVENILWEHWVFAAFCVFFRLKMFLDDLDYFKKPRETGPISQAGFTLGVVSWFFWLMSVVSVAHLSVAVNYMIFAICISTVWVISEGLLQWCHGKGEYRHIIWVIANLVYLSSLIYIYEYKLGDEQIGYIFIGLIAVVVADALISKSASAVDTI